MPKFYAANYYMSPYNTGGNQKWSYANNINLNIQNLTTNSIQTPNFQYGLNELTHQTQFVPHKFDSAYFQPKTFYDQTNNLTNLNIHPVNRSIFTTQQNNQVVDMQNYQ